jgi:hypothetical protein
MYKFPSPPISIMCALILCALPTSNVGAAFGRKDASETYRCTAKDAVGIQDNGTLDKSDPGAEIRRQHFDRVVIDIPDGDITYPSSGIRENRVVQKAGVSGDYVLLPSFTFRRNKTGANATTDFIRLHAGTGKPQARFMAFSLTYLVTGTCEIVP